MLRERDSFEDEEALETCYVFANKLLFIAILGNHALQQYVERKAMNYFLQLSVTSFRI